MRQNSDRRGRDDGFYVNGGELGYEPVGPATKLESALSLANEAAIDAAILDLNLNGQETYAVAEVLSRRGIPFVFATGYGSAGLLEHYRGASTLQKPFQRHELESAVSRVVQDVAKDR